MWQVRPAKLDDLQQILDLTNAQSGRLSSTLPNTQAALTKNSNSPRPASPTKPIPHADSSSYWKTQTPANSPAPPA